MVNITLDDTLKIEISTSRNTISKIRGGIKIGSTKVSSQEPRSLLDFIYLFVQNSLAPRMDG